MIDIEWVEGAPERLQPGMVVEWEYIGMHLIGHVDYVLSESPAAGHDMQETLQLVKRWAWLVKPHELEWIESIGARKP